MAQLAGDLSKAIMGQTDAEKAFRPWWDLLEDKILYVFVCMSMVTLPMTFLSNTPLDCTIHHSLWPEPNSTMKIPSHVRYVQSYAKKYCTETHLSPFLLYLPFTLLLAPLALTACEKIFIGLYSTESKLEEFYSLLVKESLGREDVNTMETENLKDLHEIRQAFRNSSGCYHSYLYRTAAEIVATIFLTAFFASHATITGILHPLFDCDVHGLLYQCVVPNSKFFFVVHFISMLALFAYFLCSSYNLLWIVYPRLNRLKRMLNGCQRVSGLEGSRALNAASRPGSSLVIPFKEKWFGERQRPTVRLDMYYDKKSRDFGLLMDLLAESSGLVQPLRILSMFDRHFQALWQPRDFHIHLERENDLANNDSILPLYIPDTEELEEVSILVTWEDCAMADYIVSSGLARILEYTLEIQPMTEAPIKSFQYYESLGFPSPLESDHMLKVPGVTGIGSGSKYSARFDGLDPSTKYTIHISTELEGKTVVQGKHEFQARHEAENDDGAQS